MLPHGAPIPIGIPSGGASIIDFGPVKNAGILSATWAFRGPLQPRFGAEHPEGRSHMQVMRSRVFGIVPVGTVLLAGSLPCFRAALICENAAGLVVEAFQTLAPRDGCVVGHLHNATGAYVHGWQATAGGHRCRA